MKLTGKCKEAFIQWYFTPQANTKMDFGRFQDLPPSMQYGVYVDFFDSVGVIIGFKTTSGNLPFDYNIKGVQGELLVTDYDYSKTRREARTKAIEKANEIYNNK